MVFCWSRPTKKPRPLIEASSPRPVLRVPPLTPMLWVCEPISTPVGCAPAYMDEKLARPLLKP